MPKGIYCNISGDINAKTLTDSLPNAVIQRMMYIGEMAVKEARSKTKQNDWHDRTGNLRASIGYVVLKDGNPVQRNTIGGGEGEAEAQKLLSKLSSEFPQGIVLIVCAGMNYASYVESRGYNVLASAELIARELVNKLISQLSK